MTPVILTGEHPVTTIPGPRTDTEPDPVEAARERLRARQEQLAAERAQSHAAVRAMPSPAAEPVASGAVALRAPGTVSATGRPAQIDSAQTLAYVRGYLGQFASFPTPAAQDATALWAAHAHVRDSDGRLAWRETPRLALLSSDPGSGKSRVLELLGRLCPNTYGLDTEPTAAGLAHTLASEHATVLLDETDVLLGSGKRREAVRAILLSGYSRHGTVLRMRGSKAERARVFGPVALAGLDVLETATGDTLAALLDRCIIVRMTRATRHVPDLGPQADRAGAILCKALAVWSADNRTALTGAEPEMPDGVRGRAAQIWTPLLAIADRIGDDWPDRARAACRELTVRGGIADDFAIDGMDELAGLAATWDSF